jgi:hypothetical protein
MQTIQPDDTKTIEQLEKNYWTNNDLPTPLVEKCYRYRKIPLNEMSVELVRLLIGQNIGLEFLIPKAIALLEKNVLAEGDMYEGDLIISLLTTGKDYWENHPDDKKQLLNLILKQKQEIINRNEDNEFRRLLKELDSFLEQN